MPASLFHVQLRLQLDASNLSSQARDRFLGSIEPEAGHRSTMFTPSENKAHRSRHQVQTSSNDSESGPVAIPREIGRQGVVEAREVNDRTNSGIEKGKRRLSADSTGSPDQIEQPQGDNAEWDLEDHSHRGIEDPQKQLPVSLRNDKWSSASSACSSRIPDDDRTGHRDKASTVSASLDPEWEKYTVVGIHAILDGGKLKYIKGKLDPGCVLSVMNERVVKAFNLSVREVQETVAVFQPAFGPCVTSCKRARLSFRIIPWGTEYPVEFWVVAEDKMVGDMLLGLKFLSRNKLKQDGEIWMGAVDAEWNA